MKFIHFIFFAFCIIPVSFAKPISTVVDGGYSNGKQMQCDVYLSEPTQKQKSAKLYFSQMGTGAYTTYFDHFKNQDTYFLTIDKPGIKPDLQNSGKPIVNRELFDNYTIQTLVNCTQKALYWADDRLKEIKPKIILLGHSEGSAVMINLVYNVYSDGNKKSIQDNIKALFMSGVIVQSMSEVLAFQFKGEELKNLMNAYDKHDSDYIYNHYQVGWYWFDDNFHQEKSQLVELKDLAKIKQVRSLPIEIFQGLLDEDVSPLSVQAFEKQNNDNSLDAKLNLRARYYNAGHMLNETAIFDIGVLRNYYYNSN